MHLIQSRYSSVLLLLLLSIGLRGCASGDGLRESTLPSSDKDKVPHVHRVTLIANTDGAGELLSASGDVVFVEIESPIFWVVQIPHTAQWVSGDVLSYKGARKVSLHVAPNPNETSREVVIKVLFDDGQERSVQLRQAGGAKQHIASETIPKELAHRLEIPYVQGKSGRLFVAHFVPMAQGLELNYCLLFDLKKYQAHWVAFRFDRTNDKKNVSRSEDAWADDPALLTKTAMGSYRGYDRGHIVASADRLQSREANRQTFYYSNIAPQEGPGFNQTVWVDLEKKVQGWGRSSNVADTLYVVKGLTIDRDSDVLEYVSPRGSSLQVPVAKHWYMAVLKVKGDKYSAVAFWLENRAYATETLPREAVVSVRRLEQLVGEDFFYLLPDHIEEVVETTLDMSAWPGL